MKGKRKITHSKIKRKGAIKKLFQRKKQEEQTRKLRAMEIRISDHNWKRVPSKMMGKHIHDVWIDNEGVFLCVKRQQKSKSFADNNKPHGKHDDKNDLIEMYRRRYSAEGFEMIECDIQHNHHKGYYYVSYLGKESLEQNDETPGAFFGSVAVFSDMDYVPAIEFNLWAQEDQLDIGIREKCAFPKEDLNPYDRKFDDLFVFHPLSKIRRHMDAIPKKFIHANQR